MHNDDNAAVTAFRIGAIGSLIVLIVIALVLGGCSSQPDCAQTAKQARAEGKTCFRDGQTIYYMEK